MPDEENKSPAENLPTEGIAPPAATGDRKPNGEAPDEPTPDAAATKPRGKKAKAKEPHPTKTTTCRSTSSPAAVRMARQHPRIWTRTRASSPAFVATCPMSEARPRSASSRSASRRLRQRMNSSGPRRASGRSSTLSSTKSDWNISSTRSIPTCGKSCSCWASRSLRTRCI